MKSLQKHLSFVLALLMLVSLMPTTVWADFTEDTQLPQEALQDANPYIEEEVIPLPDAQDDAVEEISALDDPGAEMPEDESADASIDSEVTEEDVEAPEDVSADPVFTITYFANTGVDDGTDESFTQEFYEGESIVIAANPFSNGDMEFASWNTLVQPGEEDYSLTLYEGEAILPEQFEDSTLLLYAQWNEPEEASGECLTIFYNHMYFDNEDITAEKIAVRDKLVALQPETATDGENDGSSKLFMAAPVYGDVTAAAALRNAMVNRQSSITLYVDNSAEENISSLCSNIVYMATRHTGNPKEGDYITWQGLGVYVQKSGFTTLTLSFTMTYVTTLSQENAVDSAVANLINNLRLNSKTDYEKIRAVYNWITANVTYNASTDLTHTAYAAVVDRFACCQGYAQLFYRMMLECGIDSRVVRGATPGGGHAWNIVKLNGTYYYADSTWDAGKIPEGYSYFLDGSEHFTIDHYGEIFYGDALSAGIGDSIYSTVLSTSADVTAYNISSEPYNPTTYLTASVSQLDLNVGGSAEFTVTVHDKTSKFFNFGFRYDSSLFIINRIDKNGNEYTFTLTGSGTGSGIFYICAIDRNYNSICKDISIRINSGSSDNFYTVTYYNSYNDASVFKTARTSVVSRLSDGRYRGTAVIPMDTPTRNGYMFSHWEDNSGNWYQPGESINVYSDFSLYAVWKPLALYISFDANGGSVSKSGQSVSYKSPYGELPTPTKPGYTFIGWFTARTGGEEVTSTTKVSRIEDHTLYAQWILSSLVVTFDPNGGSCTPSSGIVLLNSSYGELPTPSRTGYIFNGWYTAKVGGAIVLPNTPVTESTNHTLYAQWTPITYSIKFSGNGADSGSMPNQVHTYDKAQALTANTYKKQNYIFDGWAKTPDADKADFADMETVTNLVTEPDGQITLYAVWKPQVSSLELFCPELDDGNLNGKTIQLDMTAYPTISLSAVAVPAEASQYVTWTTSSASIATVSDDGLVTFEKPGTVTITAASCDGSGKSADVKLDVIYKYPSGALSIVSNTPAIGLQVKSTAQLSVFGADKTAALDPHEFIFTVNIGTQDGSEYLTVDEDGIMTCHKSGVTVNVTAALRNDPLNRSVTVSVKLIPVQTDRVLVLPTADNAIKYSAAASGVVEPGFYGIDGNGNIADSPADSVRYALYVEKIPKGAPAQTFAVKVEAKNSENNDITDAASKFTWASTNSSLVTVKGDEQGSALLTVKSNVDGACSVTATSNDIEKTRGSIAIYIMDKVPRLDASSVTLDVQKTNTVSVALVASYGAQIAEENGVIFKEYDSKTKDYIATDKVSANYDGERVTITASEFLKNQTIKGQLLITMADGTEYDRALNVVIKNSAPAITVKQPKKFNLFYTDSKGVLNVSVKNEQITGIELVSDSFKGTDNGDGTVTVEFNTPSAKPTTSAKLLISLDGYTYPIERSITIGTVTTKPTLTLTPASSTINTALGDNRAVFSVYDKTNAEYISADKMTTTATWVKDLFAAGDNVVLTLNGEIGGKAAIAVKKANWTSAITVYHTVTVSTTVPTAKLGTGTLTLNSLFAETTDETTLTLNQSNLQITDLGSIKVTAVPSGADMTAAGMWFDIGYADGILSAELTPDGKAAVKNGTYSFSTVPLVGAAELKPIVLKITVNSTKPTVKLSKTTLNVNTAFNTVDSAAVTLQNYKDSFGAFELPEENIAIDDARLKVTCDSGSLKVELADASIPNGAYKATAVYTVGGVALNPVSFTVKVVNTIPTVSASAVTLNKQLSENGTSTLKLSTKGYAVTALEGMEGNENLDINLNDDGTLTVQLTDAAKSLKAQTFSVTLTPTIRMDGLETEAVGKPFVLKVSMIDKAPSATVSASGKINAVSRGTGITYTLTKLNSAVGTVEDFALVGENADMFTLTEIEPNAKGQHRFMLTLNEGVECATNKTYKVQIRFTLDIGDEVLTPVLSVKPVQSALKLTATPTTQKYYQSQSRNRVVKYTLDLKSPAGTAIESVSTGSVSFWQNSLVDQAKKIEIDINGTKADISVTLKDTSIFNNGKSYTLPLLVCAEGSASNASPTKINLTLKVYK